MSYPPVFAATHVGPKAEALAGRLMARQAAADRRERRRKRMAQEFDDDAKPMSVPLRILAMAKSEPFITSKMVCAQDWMLQASGTVLSRLHKEGHLRRRKCGRSYRYYITDKGRIHVAGRA